MAGAALPPPTPPPLACIRVALQGLYGCCRVEKTIFFLRIVECRVDQRDGGGGGAHPQRQRACTCPRCAEAVDEWQEQPDAEYHENISARCERPEVKSDLSDRPKKRAEND